MHAHLVFSLFCRKTVLNNHPQKMCLPIPEVWILTILIAEGIYDQVRLFLYELPDATKS
jgi:hypothetical protein